MKLSKFEFTSLEDQYRKMMADYITVSVDDLSINERTLILKSLELFKDKLRDIKVLDDEIKRLSLELANLKAMNDDSDYLT